MVGICAIYFAPFCGVEMVFTIVELSFGWLEMVNKLAKDHL